MIFTGQGSSGGAWGPSSARELGQEEPGAGLNKPRPEFHLEVSGLTGNLEFCGLTAVLAEFSGLTGVLTGVCFLTGKLHGRREFPSTGLNKPQEVLGDRRFGKNSGQALTGNLPYGWCRCVCLKWPDLRSRPQFLS